jgi:hypothetical protein
LLPILSNRNSATQNSSAPATARNLLFWWLQLTSATATLSNFSFIFYCIICQISQKWIFWVKICFKLLKGSIFELQNCNIHQKKGYSIFTSYIIAEKRVKLGSHIASLKMHRTHAHRKFQQNKFAPPHRNLQPHIATRNLLSHIASHALLIWLCFFRSLFWYIIFWNFLKTVFKFFSTFFNFFSTFSKPI